MPELEVRRGYRLASDRNPRYTLLVDGAPAAKVGADSPVRVEVTAEQHEVVAKTWWIRSKPLTVQADDQALVRLRIDNNRSWGGLSMLFRPSSYLIVEPE